MPVTPCHPTGDQCCEHSTSAACVEYDGTPLTCLQGEEKEKLDTILQRIDAKICELSGGADPYNGYELACLEPVTTTQDFAEKTALMLCQLRTTVLNFINNLYPVDQTSVRAEINALNKAGFDYSCPDLHISKNDSLTATLSNIANAICGLHDSITDLTEVNWNQCTTSNTVPTTIQEGFNFIVQQLCSLNADPQNSAQITFDNTGTCLPAGGSQDSLKDTVFKIRTKLCSLPTFSANAISSSCLNLSGVTTLEQTLSKIIEQLDALSRNTIRQADTTQFQVADADPTSPCLGKKITLTAPVGSATDRLVAATGSDTTPGTLDQKIEQGTGVIIDTTSDPAKLILSVDQTLAFLVKSTIEDNQPGCLNAKISGAPGEVVTTTSVNAAGQVVITAQLNYNQIITRILDVLETDNDLKARFCALVATCPSPCSPPTNVQAIQV